MRTDGTLKEFAGMTFTVGLSAVITAALVPTMVTAAIWLAVVEKLTEAAKPFLK